MTRMIPRRQALFALGGIGVLAATERAAGQGSANRKGASSMMTITRNGAQPPQVGPADYFTGSVQIQSRFTASPPARVGGGLVTFEPGARTAWHTHPLGQTLIVTSGEGWIQAEGGPREEVRSGDIVWFPPGLKHWHGATAATAMSHIAIAEALDGKTVDWMEKVTDAQYQAT